MLIEGSYNNISICTEIEHCADHEKVVNFLKFYRNLNKILQLKSVLLLGLYKNIKYKVDKRFISKLN